MTEWPPKGIDWYYSDDYTAIACADCREIMPGLEKVDLCLTDPPYGLGDRMKGGTWGCSEKYDKMREWDQEAPCVDFILRLKIPTIIWGGNYFPLPPSRCWFVWVKQNAVPTMGQCELAWTSADRPVQRFSSPVGRVEFGHPTEKPLPLMAWCIQESRTTGTILDPYCGSGTTLRAAKDLQRKAIGIEIEEKYCEIAARRLQQEVLAL